MGVRELDPVYGHGDVGPWNIVARDGIPIAFVDWEFAGPGANDCDEAMVTPDFIGPRPMAWGMARPIRSARWILDHANLLRQLLEANR